MKKSTLFIKNTEIAIYGCFFLQNKPEIKLINSDKPESGPESPGVKKKTITGVYRNRLTVHFFFFSNGLIYLTPEGRTKRNKMGI